ncbi:MAG: PAS domain S-box protein [SAR324 cluster bacterium]|nr:PAS domain S-box protein [SAR324 cluster bacterium]
MKLRTQLVFYATALIMLTSIASVIGASFLTSSQTIRQNEERLQDALEGLERRLYTMISMLERQVLNYTINPSYPSEFVAEINRLEAGTMEMNEFGPNPLVSGLYNLGRASDVKSFALYIPHGHNQDVDKLLYVFSPLDGGLIGIDKFGTTLYTLNIWGTFHMKEIVPPESYPRQFVPGAAYQFEQDSSKETLFVFNHEYRSRVNAGHIKIGDHLGGFIFKKLLEPSWEALDKEIGVHFNIFDQKGTPKGGQLPLSFLIDEAGQQGLIQVKDQEGREYDTLIKKLVYQDNHIGYLSASIPRQLTMEKIKETIVLLLMIGLGILFIVFLMSFFFAGKIVRPISDAIVLLRKISSGEKDVTHRLIQTEQKQMHEIREFFLSFNEMLNELHRQKEKVDQYIKDIEYLRDYSERIVDSIQTGIVSINQNYQIEKVNQVFTESFHQQKDDLIGKDVRCIALPFLDEQIHQDIKKIIMGQSDSLMTTKRIPPRHIYEIKLFPFSILQASKTELGCLLLVVNVSQKIELEEKISQAERLTSLSILSAGVAHEINNPLSSIVSNVHNLLGHSNLTEEDRTTSLKWVKTEALRIEKIVSQLLDFSRTDKIFESTCSVNQTIGQVVNLVQLSKAHQISIELSLNEDVDSAALSEGELKQILINLIDNSIHACGARGHIKIETSIVDEEKNVLILVKDDGIGISEERLTYVFDPFYSSKSGKGSGLGLSMVYGLIKKHNGDIRIKSTVGLGTTFELRLPCYSSVHEEAES